MEMIQTTEQAKEKRFWWRDKKEAKNTCAIRHQPGHPCPECREGVLSYDGLFMLTCPVCGFIAESGAFT